MQTTLVAARPDLEGGQGTLNGRDRRQAGGQMPLRRKRVASTLVAIAFLLLAVQGELNLIGCKAATAPFGTDLSAPIDSRDEFNGIEPLIAFSQAELADGAAGRRLALASSLPKSKLLLNHAIETGCKKLAENCRELLLFQQQQLAGTDKSDGSPLNSMDSAISRFARDLNQRNAVRLMQLADGEGAAYELAADDMPADLMGRPLMLSKKAASPRHTPRFGRRR